MLNLIFQANPNGTSTKCKTKCETKEKCSESSKSSNNCYSSMPSIITISTIVIGSLLISIFCVIKVQQNAENLFQSFMQNKVFVNRVEKIVQNYIDENYPGLGTTESITSRSNDHQHVQNERKSNFIRQKRSSSSNLYDDNVLLGPPSRSDDDPEVEFFNPKLRHELEKKDAEIMAKTKLKGAAPGGDQWVWLTSYSRIPYGAITGFCQATKEYCPPGPPGVPGVPGAKGNRGDIGIPGPPGLDGREGKMGPRGHKGERGLPGGPGLDGRDGIPGEPGLDGIPGRSGPPGLEGPEGKMGPRGPKGEQGKSGMDGKIGPVGPPGPQGEQGIRGLPGPRGRSGKPGINGTPGTPGINAWKVKVNGTLSSDLLIPPSIIGADSSLPSRPIIIYENEHLRLQCAATGTPKPSIEWRREDGHTINTGSWEASSMSGHTLNITHINREHMGAYRCMADNGIPPQANQTFYVEVHFAPMIVITNPVIYAANGTKATLECKVEAYPEPLRYWERFPDGRLLEPGDKYQMETITNGYKSVMRLNITITSNRDYGEYHCISKNEMSLARGVFHVQDRSSYIVQPRPELQSVQIYGNQPPKKTSIDDICGPPTMCPECPDPKDFKCKDAVVSLYDLVGNLQINPTSNLSYPGLANRTLNCQLYAIGKPVFHKFSEEHYGSALKDPVPRNTADGEKYWCTKQNDSYRLYEYANKAHYRNNQYTKTYRLDHPFRGNAHVMYNGSFYYNERDTPRIVKFDITTERQTASRELTGLDINGTHFLYTTEYNYVDLAVDDNGLWVIYGTQDSNHTIVTKLSANDLEIEYSWNISINHHKLGEMFIVCGVLYGIDSVTDRNTKIRLALDLYKNQLLDVTLAFTNPFRTTTTVGYNHRNKELYSWDRGNQLTYPVRYHESELGSNVTTSAERTDELTSLLTTGHHVYHDNNGAV